MWKGGESTGEENKGKRKKNWRESNYLLGQKRVQKRGSLKPKTARGEQSIYKQL